ncbi:FAD-dependent monooxygenase [Streptomyces fagopyri]
MSSENTYVLVVGAGPAGLILAGDLAESGVKCSVKYTKLTSVNP